MKYSIAIRLKDEHRKEFKNATFLISDFDTEGDFYSIGENILKSYPTYESTLDFIKNNNYRAISTPEIESFDGEFICDFNPKFNQFFVSQKRPDNIMYWGDLRDELYL